MSQIRWLALISILSLDFVFNSSRSSINSEQVLFLDLTENRVYRRNTHACIQTSTSNQHTTPAHHTSKTRNASIQYLVMHKTYWKWIYSICMFKTEYMNFGGFHTLNPFKFHFCFSKRDQYIITTPTDRYAHL